MSSLIKISGRNFILETNKDLFNGKEREIKAIVETNSPKNISLGGKKEENPRNKARKYLIHEKYGI